MSEVKEELEQLRKKLKELEIKQTITAKPQSPVYIKSERKIPSLAGRPVKESDPDVDDWLSDIKEHLSSIPTKDGKIDFILDHLTGAAKTEVRLRPPESKKTPEDILKIIEDTYKIQDTVAQLRHKFYERVQHENESLESYSLALMKMLHTIAKKEGSDYNTMDKIITDKFIDGVQDQQIKRELRKFSLENPTLPFIEFRGRILMWVDDQNATSGTAKINRTSTEKKPSNDDLIEILRKQQEILEKQQQQIELLTNLTKQPKYEQSRSTYQTRGYYRGTFRGRGRGRGTGRGMIQQTGQIICFRCGKEGHKSNKCSSFKEKKPENNPKA